MEPIRRVTSIVIAWVQRWGSSFGLLPFVRTASDNEIIWGFMRQSYSDCKGLELLAGWCYAQSLYPFWGS